MRRFSLFIVLLLASACATLPSGSGNSDVMVFLVRHTERTDDVPGAAHEQDPHLSEDGLVRASALAEMLTDAGLTQIHSTDFQRTRETAGPTVSATGLELALYDPNDLEAFADLLRSGEGRHLVVGHSNTTWDLVEVLGGEPGPPIESLEYDRLYILTLDDGEVDTVLLRFGAPFRGIPSPHPPR